MLTDNYDSIEDLLITEMIETEEKITPRALNKMADIYQLSIEQLEAALPVAEAKLYKLLQDNLDLQEEV